jgi:ABC-type multidrug transport system ATPase subunit
LIDGLRSAGMAVVLTTHYMEEAERLSDRLVILQDGRVRAAGASKAVLGDVVGEHVVVVAQSAAGAERVEVWLSERGSKPAVVLGQWHLAFDAAGLSAFVAAFPDLRYEVRTPTLDDLFLSLSEKGGP